MNIRNIFRPVAAFVAVPIGYLGGYTAGPMIQNLILNLRGLPSHPDDISGFIWSGAGALLGMIILPVFTWTMAKPPE